MKKSGTKGFFVTATDTDAGKTFISAGLLQYLSQQGYKTLGFKPVASGCQLTESGLRNDDALRLIKAANVSLEYSLINPYAFEPAIAPHIAAEKAGVEIDLQAIASIIQKYQKQADYFLVEGVGGWLVPLNEHESIADLAALLKLPVILVVNMRLGCINHALLTAHMIRLQGLKIAGWVANTVVSSEQMSCLDKNIQAIEARISAPLLGIMPNLSDPEVAHKKHFADYVDLDRCN